MLYSPLALRLLLLELYDCGEGRNIVLLLEQHTPYNTLLSSQDVCLREEREEREGEGLNGVIPRVSTTYLHFHSLHCHQDISFLHLLTCLHIHLHRSV